MTILIDTHILIWHTLTPNRLSSPAIKAIQQANQGNGFLICDISLWEIAMLIQKRRIQINTDTHSFINLILQANNCQVVPITPQIASLSVGFTKKVNNDPADRLILATTVAENASLVTADQNLRAAQIVPTIW